MECLNCFPRFLFEYLRVKTSYKKGVIGRDYWQATNTDRFAHHRGNPIRPQQQKQKIKRSKRAPCMHSSDARLHDTPVLNMQTILKTLSSVNCVGFRPLLRRGGKESMSLGTKGFSIKPYESDKGRHIKGWILSTNILKASGVVPIA
jgi:hypothetical protein